MSDLHILVPDEATIKIVNPRSGVLGMAPPNLKKPYWVCLSEGGNYTKSFSSLEEAIEYIKQEALYATTQK